MPFSAIGDALGSVGSSIFGSVAGGVAGAATSSLLGPSTSGGNAGGSYYTPTGLAATDQGWQGLQQGNTDFYNQNNQMMQQLGYGSLQNGLNAQAWYGPGAQNASNTAGQTSNAFANTLSDASNFNFNSQAQAQQQGQQAYGTLTNQGQQSFNALTQAGQQVFNQATDPNQALYNRSVQQLQDQTGATNSMYGLGSSGAGAGVANQALSNFGIDWNTQQLQNSVTGLNALNSAYSQGDSALYGGYSQGQSSLNGANSTALGYGNLATQQGGQVAGLQNASGQYGLQTAQTNAAATGQLGNTYGAYNNANVYGPAQSIQSQAIPYMNYGQGAQTLPYQQQTANANALGGSVANGVSNAFSNGFSGFGSSGTGYFGSTGSQGNYTGTGFGGYGLGSGATNAYTGSGNTYGFTS